MAPSPLATAIRPRYGECPLCANSGHSAADHPAPAASDCFDMASKLLIIKERKESVSGTDFPCVGLSLEFPGFEADGMKRKLLRRRRKLTRFAVVLDLLIAAHNSSPS